MLMPRLIFFLLFFPFFCFGQIPKPKLNTYVNDNANVLHPYEIQQLNEQLFALEKQTTVQMAILLIDSLPPNMSIEDYARTVGNTWKVGNQFNGIVYVVVLKERKHRLEIARNLEGDIPDITASEIIESLKPYLKEKKYFEALQSLVSKVSSYVGAEISQPVDTSSYIPSEQNATEIVLPTSIERTEFEKAKAKYDSYGNYAIGAIILGLVAFCVWAWRYKKKYVKAHTVNGVYTGIGSSYYASMYGGNSSDGDGGSSGFGGWGGGGGGGGFSGGGASGSW